MSFRECINRAVQSGAIDEADQARINDIFDGHMESNRAKMPEGTAEIQSTKDTLAQIDYEAMHRKRKKILQAQVYKARIADLRRYKREDGSIDLPKGFSALLDADATSPFASVSGRQATVRQMAYSKMDEFLQQHKRNLLGQVRNKAQLRNVVREVFDEGSTGDAVAMRLAQSWREASNYLLARFNSAGGMIAKREDWGFPQVHDRDTIRATSKDDWVNETFELLDRENMLNDATGLPFTEEGLRLQLSQVYDTIVTNGTANKKVTAAGGGKSLANTRKDHRFLKFKDADSWMKYQDKYGRGNIFDNIITHIDTMSRDIAYMEILGPNPNATIQYMKNYIEKELEGNTKQLGRARRYFREVDNLHSYLSGRSNIPVNDAVATTFATIRNVLTSAQLGRAFFAAITDFNFVRIAKQFNGLPMTGTLKDYLKHMVSLGPEERGRAAIRAGLIAEGWTAVASGQLRIMGEVSGTEFSRRISDFVLRATLLSPHTQANRWAFGMSVTGSFADEMGKKFSDLDPKTQALLERSNIRAEHWDIIRQATPMEYEGSKFLTAPDIEAMTATSPKIAQELANRWSEMLTRETNFAVPSSSARGRVSLVGEGKAGTLAGELLRSFAQYKNFGVTILNTHVARGLAQNGKLGKFKYMSDLLITSAFMGAMALQMKEIAKGRDPQDMNDPKFWGSALLQGGGLGIYGDFLFANRNRFGGGLPETLAGPTASFVGDTFDLSIGNAIQAFNGDDTNVAAETLDFAKKYMPGSSMWYLSLASERLIFDQLDLMANPKAGKDMRRLEKKFERERGQRYWWRPSKTAPSRAPDLGAATENFGD